MSFFSDLKNTDLVTFIGKSGVQVLSKALESVFAETDVSASDLSKALHLKSRCLMAWLEEMRKSNVTFSRIPLTATITSKIEDYVVSFTEGKARVYHREIRPLNKNVDCIYEGPDSLPEVAAFILTLPQFQDEIGSSDFKKSADLDKMIQSLVQRHSEFLATSQQLLLHKGEEQARCPDCGEQIRVSEKGANLCICYKFFTNNSIHVVKNNNNGLTLHFSKSWNKENISLFARALKNKLKTNDRE